MPALPLGLESYERRRGSLPETRLCNLYLEEDKSGSSVDETLRLQRPGLRELVTFPAGVRGIFQSDGVQDGLTYVVAGNKFYSTDWATFTEIGTVPNDGLSVRIAANFERIGMVTYGEFWTYDGATLAQIDLPDDRVAIDLDVINSYFIVGTATGTFFWLVPGEITFDPLDFATAESMPDGLLAVRRLKDDIFFFGTSSIEVWQPTGDADSTFVRAAGRLIDRGVHSRDCVAPFDNSVIFVGDDGLVYRLADVPERVSTFGIEERTRLRDDLCSAFTFTTEGHKFYCLRIPGEGTFALDAATKKWSEFATISATVWRAHTGIDTSTGPVAGDSTGKLYALDPDQVTDDGATIERILTGTIALPPNRISNYSLSLWIGCEADATVSIRWKDGLDTDWSNPITRTAREGSDIVNAWRLGASRGAFRTFEIKVLTATNIRISGATLNEARAA